MLKKINTKQFGESTVKATVGVIKWIFVFLILYISIVTILGYLSSGMEFLGTIAALSVGGFWAFFFGYFGWRIGQSIEEHFISNIKEVSKKK